jgi:tRNA A58 N-methylase Trm61
VKAPLRVQHFKRALPNVSLPPEPVLTRWGTWLDAAVYYANNFQDFKKIVLDLTDTTTKAITDCKDVMQRPQLQNNLVFIKANYNFVTKTIEHLEKQQLLLTESIKIIEKFKERILLSRVK